MYARPDHHFSAGQRGRTPARWRAAVAINHAPVELWTCTGGANQQWQATGAGTLVNPVSGKCLDDPKLTTPSTQLEIYTCDGSANQQWKIP